MKKTILFISFVTLSLTCFAKEGMWIPSLLEALEDDMKAMGMRLSAEDIYSINNSSLKDAVIHFNGGCTSELISSDGLLLTNHHCGYGAIQSHSSVENDYLTDGFWAMNLKEELANPNMTATRIVRIEDVTEKILKGVTAETSDKEREKIIQLNATEIAKEAKGETNYEIIIRPFYYGNEYYMFVNEVFKDVRLVGAPPSSIGKFGGDTDNWMWPRHTGDFSLFRIYVDKNNDPAPYSEENVPYQPKHFLPISIAGIQEGDFTMVYGFPGRTQEYLPSYAVDQIMNVRNPARINFRDKTLGLMLQEMEKSQTVRIQYASKYASTANYYKKWQGENRGLRKLNAIETKKELEQKFTERVNKAGKEVQEKYAGLLPAFEQHYELLAPYALARDYFVEMVYYVPDLLQYTNGFRDLVEGELSEEEREKEIEAKKKGAVSFFKNYHQPIEKKTLAAALKMYSKSVDANLQPEIYATIQGKYDGNYSEYVDAVFEKSMFVSRDRVEEMLNNFSAKKVKKDPMYELTTSFFNNYYTKVFPVYSYLNNKIDSMQRVYMEGLRKFVPEEDYFPDANSTLRLTYGKVEGYEPADGVEFNYYTTLDGVIAKYVPNDREFDLPEKLIELYEQKDYGRYGVDGTLPVCFTASNHTTGGNSGSPVIDANGNLIGINFDRGWEGTMSDIMFDPERCRNISVDSRYLLFIIDKFAGASHLLDNMKIIDGTVKKEKVMSKEAPAN